MLDAGFTYFGGLLSSTSAPVKLSLPLATTPALVNLHVLRTTMVIKTDPCAFSDNRVYPGHGIRFVRRDGQPVTLFSSKCKNLLLKQRKKPAKLTWTQAWRRLNKKIKIEEVSRRRTRKATKLNRAYVGASLEEIKKKRSQKPEVRSAQREAAAKEVKARKTAKKAASKGSSVAMKAKPTASKQKGGSMTSRAGSKR